MVKKIPLKQIFSRRLKNGKYVILAANSDPLVVEEEFARYLTQKGDVLEICDENTISIFKDSGFFIDGLSDTFIPTELKSVKWRMLQYGLLLLAVMSLLVILIRISSIGISFGDKMIPINVPIWMSILFMISFSILTTMIHEMMHMLYAQTWREKGKGVNIILKKSVATVSMTHIWVWSFWGRFSAIVAGIISDLFILASCLIFQLYFNSWIIASASSILWLRILWQFRVHKKSDGRLIIMVILDNPMIPVRNEQNSDFSKKEIFIWRVFNIFGICIDLIIFLFWIVPALSNIYFEVFKYFI